MSDISLQEMLQRGSLPRKPFQLSLLRQTAAQLDHAHQRGLVHGNLTPQSIFVSQNDTGEVVAVRMRDFGTKFNLEPAIASGRVPIEAFYLSPEQILGIDVTAQSDEFSFAAIAYEIVSSKKPFNSATVSGLIFTICTDEPPPIHEVDASLTSGVSQVFSRALAKDREQRYAECGQFIAALESELLRCRGWAGESPASAAVTQAAPMPPLPFREQAPPPSVRVPEAPQLPAIPVASEPTFARLPGPGTEAPPLVAAPVPEQTPTFRTAAFASAVFAAPSATPPPNRPPPQARPVSALQPAAQWSEPRYEAPPRAELEFPPLRRRQRYDEEELPARESPFKKYAVAALILLLIAAGAAYLLNRTSKPDLPTQVLDTKAGPASPPPESNDTQAARNAAPSSAPSPEQRPAPAPSETAPQARVRPRTGDEARTEPPQTVPAPPVTQGQPRQDRTPVPAPTQTTHRGSGAAVELLSQPPGAAITIDNNPLMTCRAPCTMSLGSGRHTLAAQLPGYTLAQRIFNVPETTSVFVALPKLSGALVVTSSPTAATILVDGKDFGLTPATLHLPPGQHRITLMNGSQRHDETVTVVADGIQATGYTFPR